MKIFKLLIGSAIMASCFNTEIKAQGISPEMLGITGEAEFIDMARHERAWEKIAGGDATVDANGWPTEDAKKVFFDKRAFGAWWGEASIDDPDKYNLDMSGTWKLSYDGQADISIVEGASITFTNKVYNASTNRTTVDVTLIRDRNVQSTSICYLQFTNTKRTASSAINSGISNVKMIRPGYSVDSKELFVDGFYDALCPFKIWRTMGMTHTNSFPPIGTFFNPDNTISWSERKSADAPNQIDKDGTAWEHLIAAANRADKYLWINIPIHADASYMEGLAKLFKATYKPAKLYFEISNEVWNFGFPQYQYNSAAAGDEVEKNPSSNLKKPGETKATHGREWEVRRTMRMTIEMVKAFQKEYGNDCVGKSIFPQYAWWTWVEKEKYDQALQWCNDTYGPPKNFIHGMSISGYAEDNGGTRSTVDQLIGLQKPYIDKRYTNDFLGHKATADKWGIKLTVYEGSTNFVESFNIANKINTVRDPRFEEIVKYLVQDTWFDKLKGAEFCFFALAGSHSNFGTWGIAESDFTKERWENNPKWKALTKMVGKTCPMNGVGPTSLFSSAESMSKSFELYPNPTQGIVNISSRTYMSETVDVSINNLTGKPLKKFDNLNVSSQAQIINVSDLENGAYIISIKDGARVISEKLILSK
jgi:hypothetical protein